MFILNKLCVGKQFYVNGGIPQLLSLPLWMPWNRGYLWLSLTTHRLSWWSGNCGWVRA